MRVALVQLPVQSHDYGYSIENVPLAAGYLAAYASVRDPGMEFLICPPDIANRGGDALILKWLEGTHADIVGFSCYVWNIDRTLYLCGRIKERMGHCLVVLGGPEINSDNGFLMSSRDFDVGVVGEGEETFFQLLQAFSQGRADIAKVPGLLVREGTQWVSTLPGMPLKDLDDIPSPYQSGILDVSPRKTMILETVRGCPMRCAYCYYHKHLSRVRPFAMDRIASEFQWAHEAGVAEITIVDPCFGRRPGLMQLLESLTLQAKGTIPFSCELNAEDLDERLVTALAKAGLVHVEIGLQSTNRKTLNNIGRPFNREAFMKGVRLLRNAGIRVMTDIMAGLPGDSLEDVRRSIDFVLGEGLCDDLSLYPLSLLPGTTLRTLAEKFSITYQPRPPYLVTGTADMDSDDICEAFRYVEDVTGIDYFPVELPRPGISIKPGPDILVDRIVLDSAEGAPLQPGQTGQALCMDIRDPLFLKQGESLGKILGEIMSTNPYTLATWIIPDVSLQDQRVMDLIESCRPGIDHPADREYMDTYNPVRSCRILARTQLETGEILTQVPLPGEYKPRPLWAFIPASAGPDHEQAHTRHMAGLLGQDVEISYHDYPEEKPDIL